MNVGRLGLFLQALGRSGYVGQMLTGSGAPGAGVGNDGDYYFDTANFLNLYGPKVGGSWPAATNLAPSTADGDVYVGSSGRYTPLALYLAIAGFGGITFGDGSAGDFVASGVVAGPSNEFYARNITFLSGGQLVMRDRLYVSQRLDVVQAQVAAIQYNGFAGGDAAANVAGAAGSSLGQQRTFSNGVITVAGAAGGVAAGASPAVTPQSNGRVGGDGGGGGGGGAGSGGAGGAAGTFSGAGTRYKPRHIQLQWIAGNVLMGGGGSGAAGASGGGDGTAGGGGGGGSSGGGSYAIFAREIMRSSANANAGIIQAIGGNGGMGGTPAGGNRGGGGGGGGAGGGWVYVVAGKLLGTAHANAIDVSSGAGGQGGAKTGTGVDGAGGQGGLGGYVNVFALASSSGTNPYLVYDATAMGNNAAAGRTGGAAFVARCDL